MTESSLIRKFVNPKGCFNIHNDIKMDNLIPADKRVTLEVDVSNDCSHDDNCSRFKDRVQNYICFLLRIKQDTQCRN